MGRAHPLVARAVLGVHMSYQDVLDARMRVLQAGTRDCASRYDAIALELINLRMEERRGFTVLDLGAYLGYFALRLAEEFDARVTAVDDFPGLKARCGDHPKIRVIPRRLSPAEVAELGRFEVVLALSVLHHIPEWAEMLEVLLANSDLLFVEVPDPTEVLPKAVAHCPELTAAVEQLGGRAIARTAGHRSQIERTTWLVT